MPALLQLLWRDSLHHCVKTGGMRYLLSECRMSGELIELLGMYINGRPVLMEAEGVPHTGISSKGPGVGGMYVTW